MTELKEEEKKARIGGRSDRCDGAGPGQKSRRQASDGHRQIDQMSKIFMNMGFEIAGRT